MKEELENLKKKKKFKGNVFHIIHINTRKIVFFLFWRFFWLFFSELRSKFLILNFTSEGMKEYSK